AEGDDLAGRDVEVDAAQDLAAAQVAEAHVLEADLERAVGKAPRLVRLGQGRDVLEPGEAAAGRGERALAEVRDPAERLEWPDELEQELDEERELAVGERAVDHAPAAEVDDDRDGERREKEEAGEVARLDARLAEDGV